jgi:hypothetical protein
MIVVDSAPGSACRGFSGTVPYFTVKILKIAPGITSGRKGALLDSYDGIGGYFGYAVTDRRCHHYEGVLVET